MPVDLAPPRFTVNCWVRYSNIIIYKQVTLCYSLSYMYTAVSILFIFIE